MDEDLSFAHDRASEAQIENVQREKCHLMMNTGLKRDNIYELETALARW